MSIIKLSPEVIGQIAAGEVVERPSAAVKELVENSMDAGATAITVDIRDGGLGLIRVMDNGSGIDPSQLRMAFERHATSKLRSAEDLHHVESLGFRGEALAAIAAVSKVRLVTRRPQDDTGMQIDNHGGQFVDLRPAASAEGTTVTVSDLFYNAPVRRRFMKKPNQEAGLVADLMLRLILSHPEVSFRLQSDGKPVYFSPGDGRLESAVTSVFGLNFLRQLHPVNGNQSGLMLSGFVGVGEASRGNRSQQLFFVNGRALRSQLLSGALEEACRQRVMIGRFPVCVLHLTLPYEAVDVNVHPNKWELRFQDEQGLTAALRDIVSDALSVSHPVQDRPPLFPVPEESQPVPARISRYEPIPAQEAPAFLEQRYSLRSAAFEEALVRSEPEAPAPVPEPEPEQVSLAEEVPELQETPVRLIGAAFNTYIIYETEDIICLCDQHAMHERLIFDRLMAAYEQGAVAQTMLMPIAIRLSYREYGSFLEYQALLSAAGFDAEDFGEQTVRLHSLPIMLSSSEAEDAFLDTLEQLSGTANLKDDRQIARIMQTACKHAVKGGERLPDDALMALVRQVIDGKTTPTCPHGRPLMVQLTRTELEKRFRRIP